MSDSYDFRDTTLLAAGAIGEPGNRTFYLQLADPDHHVTLKLEKQQVLALAQFLRGVLDDLPAASPQLPSAALTGTIEPLWAVGQIAVGIDEADAEIVLMVEELTPFDEDDEDDDAISDLFDDVGQGHSVRARISVDQAVAFVAMSDDLSSKGRPPCRLCGQPETPGGHACPRLN